MPHLDESGAARMVDVGEKGDTKRVASAEGFLHLSSETSSMLFAGALPKGDAVAVARVAGIMAAKNTAALIPLCHPLAITAIDVAIEPVDEGARVEARIETVGPTGVEMEALTAVSVAILSLYDMVKARERAAEIGPIRLLSKSGGRSGEWHR